MSFERLDKYISSQLNVSRKDVKLGIRKGFALIDGKPAICPEEKVNTELQTVSFNGQAISFKKYIYIVMNKPKGIISASADKKRQTVIDLVPEQLKRTNLFPVGRLDRDTTGLLLITDDGDFAHKVISPKSKILKSYIAELDGNITDNIIDQFKKGITLADETKCLPAILEKTEEKKAEIKIFEGKYHQVKRMFGIVDLGVNELHRCKIGGLTLPKELAPGQCRELTNDEIFTIFNTL